MHIVWCQRTTLFTSVVLCRLIVTNYISADINLIGIFCCIFNNNRLYAWHLRLTYKKVGKDNSQYLFSLFRIAIKSSLNVTNYHVFFTFNWQEASDILYCLWILQGDKVIKSPVFQTISLFFRCKR